ncbi:MAG TPA: hypothetical protein ENJ95_12710 [Bacteroidetes bacterium]|nr:hypothetical protein [Bacteroidota bacterium]
MVRFSSVAILTVLLSATGLVAQQETLFGDSGLRLTGVWAGPSMGMSFFNNETVATRGAFWGAEFNEIILVGFGNEKTFEPVQLVTGEPDKYTFKHGGFFVAYHPVEEKLIHPVFSFKLGSGEVKNNFAAKDKVFAVQPAGGFEINVFQWWKVGMEGGYLFTSRIDMPNLSNQDLSAFFVNLKLRFGFSW